MQQLTADGYVMTQVLFVDDDERVLRGIRRTMRSTHPDWEMSFAGDSEAALEHLEHAGADVIVSDAQMSGVDGLALLQLVRMRHPETARIMLTGQVKKDRTYDAVGLVHQFLAKPCPPEELQAAIDRALHLRSLLDDPTLRSVVARMRALPSQPDVYTRLMNAVRSEEAVVFIGTKTLRTLVLSVEAFRDLELDASGRGVNPAALQEHAVTTARISAEMVPASDRDAAYAAGLLHSIGVLVLASQLAEDWGRIIEEARSQQRSLFEVEKLVLGVDHGQVAAALLSLWGLPHDVIEAVAQHLHPSPVAGFGGSLVAVTHVASRFADEIGPPVLDGVPGTPSTTTI